MTNTTQARVLAGVPTGGQFAKTAHSDAVPSLEAAPRTTHTAQLSGTIELHNDWFDTLPEWPAGLPEPEVNFGFDDGKVETYVTIDGKLMTFWNSDMDGVINDTDNGSDNQWEDFDEEDQEAAKEWSAEVHKRVDSATYGVMIEGSHSTAVKDIILAHAIGKEPAPAKAGPDLTDETVRRAYIEGAQERVFRAQKELQQVYLIGAAQELQAQHPEIDSFELSGDGDEPRMDVAWDKDGNQIDQNKLSQANHDVFRYRSHDDFETLMTSEAIYVSEAITFRPGV